MTAATLKSTRVDAKIIQLANTYAKLRRAVAPLQVTLDQLTATIKESGYTEIRGADFTLRIQKQTRHQVPQPTIRREMGEKWYNENCTNTEFLVLNFVDES